MAISKMHGGSVVSLLVIAVVAAHANALLSPTALDPEENLLSDYAFKNELSFRPANESLGLIRGLSPEIGNGVWRLKMPAGKKTASVFTIADLSTVLAGKLTVEFEYSLKGSAAFGIGEGKNEWLSAGEKLTYKGSFSVSPDTDGIRVMFTLRGEDTELMVKQPVIKAVLPESVDRKPVLINEEKAAGIWWERTSDLRDSFIDQRSAMMLQKELYLAGGDVVPVILLKPGMRPRAGFAVGRAAEKYLETSGLLQQLREGGYAYRVRGSLAAIAGAHPSGLQCGVFALLKEMGFYYPAAHEPEIPEKLVLRDTEAASNPTVVWRRESWQNAGMRMNGTDPVYYAYAGGSRGGAHTLNHILRYPDFAETRPDFFAMLPDGTRNSYIRKQTFYCFRNPELVKEVIRRYREIMSKEKIGRYIAFGQGDGGTYCQCPECRRHTPTDNCLWMVNQVVETLCNEFPGWKFMQFAYVGLENPPLEEKPHKELLIEFCAYGEHWRNHLQLRHRDNAKGLENFAAWSKVTEKFAAYTYPTNTETLHVWPAFYGNIDKYEMYIANRLYAFYYFPVQVPGQPGNNMFNPLNRAMIHRLLWNGCLDRKKDVDDFIAVYYGKAAAEDIRYVFDRLHQEVVGRNWSQNCEEIRRGFMTQELAEDVIARLDKALNANGGKEPFARRIEIEKLYPLYTYIYDINPGNGKMQKKDFPFFCQQVSELCRLSRKYQMPPLRFGKDYRGRGIDAFFYNTMFVKVPIAAKWYDEAIVTELINHPEKVLGSGVPCVQQEIPDGLEIPITAFVGGETQKTTWLLSKQTVVKYLRRPVFGSQTMSAGFKLDEIPAEGVELKISGVDNEKKNTPPTVLRFVLNGVEIHKGNAPWEKNRWSEFTLKIHASALKAGANTLSLSNITEETAASMDERIFTRNKYWGWVAIRDVKILYKK